MIFWERWRVSSPRPSITAGQAFINVIIYGPAQRAKLEAEGFVFLEKLPLTAIELGHPLDATPLEVFRLFRGRDPTPFEFGFLAAQHGGQVGAIGTVPLAAQRDIAPEQPSRIPPVSAEGRPFPRGRVVPDLFQIEQEARKRASEEAKRGIAPSEMTVFARAPAPSILASLIPLALLLGGVFFASKMVR